MRKQITNFCLLALIGLFFLPGAGRAQEAEVDHSYKPLVLKLDESGRKYIRFIVWHQQWVSSNNLAADDSNLSFTSSIRRSRVLAFAQISPRFLILTHFGLNGLTQGNLTSLGNNGDAPQLFLHDAWTEFKVSNDDALYLGGGLHYWKGLTRLSSASTLNFMTMDQSRPFVHWHSLGITDQFARHLGIYAKGQLGAFDYRLAVNNPGANPLGGGADYGAETNLTYTGAFVPDDNGDQTGNTIVEGYGRYNFWDKESVKLPYNVGTYLGARKVLAVGAGFFMHPNGMYNTETGEHEGVTHFAVDGFLDMPVGEEGNCLNAYASFISFNYGDNYLSRWAGTGTNLYGQLGYLLGSVKSMPYVAFQTSSYDALDENPAALDIGWNYFINGHHAKVTLEYHNVFNDPREGGANDVSQIRLQGHIFL